MNKLEKFNGCVALCKVAYTNLLEVSNALTSELSALFKALGIEDQDAEKIEDAQLYGIALDLEYNSSDLKSKAEDLLSVIKDLERVKL